MQQKHEDELRGETAQDFQATISGKAFNINTAMSDYRREQEASEYTTPFPVPQSPAKVNFRDVSRDIASEDKGGSGCFPDVDSFLKVSIHRLDFAKNLNLRNPQPWEQIRFIPEQHVEIRIPPNYVQVRAHTHANCDTEELQM
ncbi:hypothetical protein HYFRA_00009505 [Hymenoscyphus fraxineus]|uniref:Uncharacterized protein n=1 Tax=Hymenoscyphus fraxineus TaxID=746836 RepID=A0A9N9PQA0_9HELO|nr:hypothetical protein HYFRA_00009505 [Hymenoscyphus fraxineus]